MLSGEAHVSRDSPIMTTLAGYVHYAAHRRARAGRGRRVGHVPHRQRDRRLRRGACLTRFDEHCRGASVCRGSSRDILPRVLTRGRSRRQRSPRRARALLDPSGTLQAGIPLCPPEGDAGTGMTATNSRRAAHGQRLRGHVGVRHGSAGKAASARASRDRSW